MTLGVSWRLWRLSGLGKGFSPSKAKNNMATENDDDKLGKGEDPFKYGHFGSVKFLTTLPPIMKVEFGSPRRGRCLQALGCS